MPRDIEEEETSSFPNYKEHVAIVGHFLNLNGLESLNFKMSRDTLRKHIRTESKLIPICIRDHERSSTTVFIDHFEYDYDTEVLTVSAEELLRYF